MTIPILFVVELQIINNNNYNVKKYYIVYLYLYSGLNNGILNLLMTFKF